MSLCIRAEEPGDIAAIEAVILAAFRNAPHTGHNEHCIVDALRRAGALSVSLVAEEHGSIIGHVAFSPVALSQGDADWYGLGPVSVEPRHQGKGIGSRLIGRGLSALRDRAAAGCVVLGEPQYYGRFGFRVEPGLLLPGVPPGYFQAMTLCGPLPSGTVAYHGAFEALR
jgi:putative acetyltransferase